VAKFYGPVGYGESVESPPGSGVYKDVITERICYGDVITNIRRTQETGEKLNRDITVENAISVLADAVLTNNFFAIRYIKWMGVYWTINTIEVRSPRLILRLGEVYNGPRAD